MQHRSSYLVGKAFQRYLWAAILTVAATQLANLVDASLVGQLISGEALAAVNTAKPIIQIVYAVATLFVVGGSIQIGMSIGKNDYDKANRIFSFILCLILGISLVFTIFGLAFLHPLMDFLCSSDSLRQMAIDYARVIMYSLAPYMVMFLMQSYVSVDGSPKLVSVAVIIANVINVLLDIVFIKFFGLGIAGAAWSTFVMYLVAISITLSHFHKPNTLRFVNFLHKPKYLREICSYGLPTMLSGALMAIQMTGCIRVATQYLGDDGLVILSVCFSLLMFSMIFLTGTLRTIQPVGAILKGLDDSNGMIFLVKRAYRFLGICLICYASCIVLFPVQVAALFGANSAAQAALASKALPAYSLNIAFQAFIYILIPIYQFNKHKRIAMLISVCQSLFPWFGFWLLNYLNASASSFWGFALGQACVLVLLLPCVIIEHRHQSETVPFFLIPIKGKTDNLELTMPTSLNGLAAAQSEILAFLKQSQPEALISKLSLCNEELLKNIIDHGHAHFVDISVRVQPDSVAISLHDDGKPFDPVTYHQETGLGLLIVKGFCSDLSYKFLFNQNMVTFSMKSENTNIH